MKMTHAELIKRLDATIDVSNKDIALPVRSAFAIAKNIKSMGSAYELYDSQRLKCGDDMEKLKELLAIEVEIPIDLISESMLGETKMSPRDIMSLSYMIVELMEVQNEN